MRAPATRRRRRDHPQVRSRRSRGWRAPVRSSPRRSPSSASTSSRASRCSSSTGSPTSTSPPAAATRPRRATRASPPRSASRRTRWSCTGSRPPTGPQEGDVISVDLGVTLDGLVADSAVTLRVGEIDAEAQRLLDVCQEALAAGIEQARVGNRLSDISHAVQEVVEEARVRGRPQPRRPRRRPLLPRGPADPELRPSRARPAPPGGDDAGDRADDHGRPARRSTSTPTTGRSRRSTTRSPPISSTRWRSPPRARGCSRGPERLCYDDALPRTAMPVRARLCEDRQVPDHESAPIRQAHVRALPRDQAARHDHGHLLEPAAQAAAGLGNRGAAWHVSQE